MSRSSRCGVLAGLALALLLGTGLAALASSSPRQYYGGWAKHPRRSYHYRHYYYKPSPGYVGYKHHYAIHHPSRPKHVYFYNPYKKVYWGRCPLSSGGKPAYSLLPESARKATLEEIPESAFPPPGEMPRIPDAEDDATLELPPDDLPPDEGIPTG